MDVFSNMILLLISLSVSLCSAVEINSPSSTINQPHYQFPPNFASTTLTPFTEKTIYLPPESQTAIPYHPILTSNNLQYPYLPPSENKVPEKYPPSYSNYLKRNFEENMKKYLRRESNKSDDETEESETGTKTSPSFNQSRNLDVSVRPLPKSFSMDEFQERRDIKFPYYGPNQQQNMNPQSIRRTVPQPQNIITTVSEHPVPDQYKMASQVSQQYAPFHQGYAGTTEEPIQILRLSNEMDIDGTFRYETLTGDQTHIMQQGHIENIGTENEEQVVEGSYSYVGDNGQTYTVHYIADGNGFRATGDHLPVPPPMPEIIQRSVEYNIMEESKRPQHQQLQNYPDLDTDLISKIQHSRAQQQQNSPFNQQPARNHFTGRQPEAFSRPFPVGNSNQNANVQAASTQTPTVTNPPKDSQFSNSKLQPQVTFMASQGAHIPTPPTTTPSISRSYAMPTQEPPRFSNNYFLNRYMETNQIRQQTPNVEIENHGLPWDLQRKLREMQIQEEQKATEEAKKSISRSSTDVEDDILINFEDMNPDQYANVFYSHMTPQYSQVPSNHRATYDEFRAPHVKSQQQQAYNNYQPFQMSYQQNSLPQEVFSVPRKTYQLENYINNQRGYSSNDYNNNKDMNVNNKNNLITQNDFLPKSQTVTTSYDYDIAEARNTDDYETENNNKETTNYEPKKLVTEPYTSEQSINEYSSTINVIEQTTTEKVIKDYNENVPQLFTTTIKPTTTDTPKTQETTPVNLLTISNFYKQVPHPYSNIPSYNATTVSPVTTSTANIKDLLEKNFFLKNLHSKKANEKKSDNIKKDIEKTQAKQQIKKDVKKETYNVQKNHSYKQEDKSKKMDLSQIINLVNMKNIFESSKLVPKPANQRQETHAKSDEPENLERTNTKERMDHDSYLPNYSNYQDDESNYQNKLKGKVYKTLHRNNGNFQFDGTSLRKELTPPRFTILTSESNRKHLPPLGRAGPNMKSYLPPVFT